MKDQQPHIRTVHVTRYVTPLREGGSLPAIAEADDGFLYVLKFRGAGQGVKALVADFIVGELIRHCKLKIPEIVFAELDEAFGRTEPDEEIQDLLKTSTGLNLGLHFLSGAITYDVAVVQPDAVLASKIVWLDACFMNVDRTARNPNMLFWKNELWLIDNGAALYFHHNWEQRGDYVLRPFSQIKDHVLLPFADKLNEADEALKALLKPELIQSVVEQIPASWLTWKDTGQLVQEIKNEYVSFLNERVANSNVFLNEAINARKALI